jgi:hypothetical protein
MYIFPPFFVYYNILAPTFHHRPVPLIKATQGESRTQAEHSCEAAVYQRPLIRGGRGLINATTIYHLLGGRVTHDVGPPSY